MISKMSVFVFLLIGATLCDATDVFSRMSPSLSVDAGSNVTLTCWSDYATSSCGFELSWFYRRNGKTTGDKLLVSCTIVPNAKLEQRITARIDDNDDNNRQFHVDINNVQPEDSGEYWCYLEFGTTVHTSSNATLTVNRLPPKFPPSCEVAPSHPTIGTRITLTCTLSPEDPPSLLTWFQTPSRGSMEQMDLSRETNPGSVHLIELTLNETDNMKEFTCVAGPDTSGPNCSLTPLQLIPTVSVFPSSVTLYEGQTATFTCHFDATSQAPPVTAYEWQVNKQGKTSVAVRLSNSANYQGTFQLGRQGQTLQILNLTAEEHNKCIITCTEVPRGESERIVIESFLVVLPCPTREGDDNNLADCTSSEGLTFGPGVIVSGTLALIFLILVVVLSCCLVKYKKKAGRSHQAQCFSREDRCIDNKGDPAITHKYQDLLQEPRVNLGHPNRQDSIESFVYANVNLKQPEENGCTGEKGALVITHTYQDLQEPRVHLGLPNRRDDIEGFVYANVNLKQPAEGKETTRDGAGEHTLYDDVA